jgi:hypothetical protein
MIKARFIRFTNHSSPITIPFTAASGEGEALVAASVLLLAWP